MGVGCKEAHSNCLAWRSLDSHEPPAYHRHDAIVAGRLWNTGQQPDCVGMPRVLEQLSDGGFLDYLARIHDGYSVRHPRYDTEIVADEEYARVYPVL